MYTKIAKILLDITCLYGLNNYVVKVYFINLVNDAFSFLVSIIANN